MATTRTILGVNFFVGRPEELFGASEGAGLVVFPSAPVLVAMENDESHRQAVESADLAVADSGWMVLLCGLLRGVAIPRISGLRYLEGLMRVNSFRRAHATFWVMPNEADSRANRAWLASQGLAVDDESTFIAPRYPSSGSIQDAELLMRIEAEKPPYVVICLGGGVQERLGQYLRQHLSYRPTIVCIGAAIAFLSGQQVAIPIWADRLFLGWLFRTVSHPRQYFPRYWGALRLATMIGRHGDKSLGSAAEPADRPRPVGATSELSAPPRG